MEDKLYYLDKNFNKLFNEFTFKNIKLWKYSVDRRLYYTECVVEYNFVEDTLEKIYNNERQKNKHTLSLESLEELFSGHTIESTNLRNEKVTIKLDSETMDFIRDQDIQSFYPDELTKPKPNEIIVGFYCRNRLVAIRSLTSHYANDIAILESIKSLGDTCIYDKIIVHE